MPARLRTSSRLSTIKTEQKSFEEPPSDDEFNERVPAKRTNSRRMSTIKVGAKSVDPPSDEEFEVEKILDKRIVLGKVSYSLFTLLFIYFADRIFPRNGKLIIMPCRLLLGRILPQIQRISRFRKSMGTN